MSLSGQQNDCSAARDFRPLILLVVALLIVFPGRSPAAEFPSPGLLIKKWAAAEGVPHNTVRSIIGSRDGYLWMGTANGLARFDGMRFVTFDRGNTPEMEDDDIYSLHEDRGGDLWYRTRRGIGRRHEGRFQFFDLNHEGPFTHFGVFSEDRDGQLWLYGPKGLTKLHPDRREPVPWPVPGPAGLLKHACAARDGGLWLAADDGIWRYQDGRAELVKEVLNVGRLAAGPDGGVWALVDGCRIYHLKGDVWSLGADLGDTSGFQLFAFSNGDVWVALENRNVLFRLRGGRLTEMTERDGLLGNRVLALHEDPDGNVWAGLNAGGLYQLREKRVTVFDRSDGLLGVNASSLGQMADGTIMLNVMGSTLYRFADDRFHPYQVESTEAVYEDPTAVVPAREGGVWAGTFWGTLPRVVDGKVVQRIGSNGGTRALFTYRNGNLWRGTRTDGVEMFSGTDVTRYSTDNGLSFNNVYCFAQDRTGAVWVGTENGLNRIQDGVVTRFGLAEGLPHRFVSALCVDSSGTLWVGTLGGGLSGWEGHRFVTLTTEEGLAHDSVGQIVEDDDRNLWLATRVGLMRLPLAHLHEFLDGGRKLVTGTLLGAEDGLPGANFWTEYQPASLRAADGHLWFCTGAGVLKIDPTEFAGAARSPVVHVEDVTVDGAAVPVRKDQETTTVIPPGSERLEINYTGISFGNPARTRFRYRLKGYDRDWIEAGHSRVASYSHLPPKTYEFEVAAVSNDGVWSETNGRISFAVMPLLWETTWFRGLSTLLLVGILVAVYLWRVQGLEQRRVAQELFSRRLIDSQEQERKRIAGELHDSLGQNLLVVRNLALMGAAARDRDGSIVREFNEISETAVQALNEVRSISHALRPVELDRIGLTKSIREKVRSVGEASGIHFDVHLHEIDRLVPADDQINIYRIVQEGLSNIVKHSEADQALVEIQASPEGIKLVISDEGRGFSPASKNRTADDRSGLGFASIVERARVLGGTAEIHSHPGRGTRIEVDIPSG